MGTTLVSPRTEIWGATHTIELAANINKMIHSHSPSHLSGTGGRRRRRGIDFNVGLAVDKVPDRSNLVCMGPFAKLEAIDNFEAERIYFRLNAEDLVSTRSLFILENGAHGPKSFSVRR